MRQTVIDVNLFVDGKHEAEVARIARNVDTDIDGAIIHALFRCSVDPCLCIEAAPYRVETGIFIRVPTA